MLEDLKIILRALGWIASTQVEERYIVSQYLCSRFLQTNIIDCNRVSDFPRWRNLAHFNTVMNITFSDGNKLRDLTKVSFTIDSSAFLSDWTTI